MAFIKIIINNINRLSDYLNIICRRLEIEINVFILK